MKRYKIYSLLLTLLIVLSGCTMFNEEPSNTNNPDDTSGENQNSSNVVTRNQLGDQYYRPALTDNEQYKVSQNRGITLNLNSGINIGLFEKDLIRLSQEMFPTDNYFIQEGQYLSNDVVNSWLGRESESNPDGLNPVDTGSDENRTPRYLNSILELDFLNDTGSGLQLSGLSIGLALNSVDYYQKEQFGPWFSQEISSEEVLKHGQEIANKIVLRIREVEGLENIPIMIGLYEQAPQDDLAGGVFVAVGESNNGSTTVDSWDSIDENRMIFPLEGSDSAEGNAFANFKSEVESFFPNISGITGRAHYINASLSSLTINIVTQFYGEAEMIAYTQYLKQSATTFLPNEIDIEIIVESPSKVEAFLKKDRTESEYYSHVFD